MEMAIHLTEPFSTAKMRSSCALLVVLALSCVTAEDPADKDGGEGSPNTRFHAGGQQYGNVGGRPVGGQFGSVGGRPVGGQIGGIGGRPVVGQQFGGVGGRPVGGQQFGGVGGRPVGGQIGGIGGRPVVGPQYGNVGGRPIGGQIGGIGGIPVGGQIGGIGGRPIGGQIGGVSPGFPQAVSPPLQPFPQVPPVNPFIPGRPTGGLVSPNKPNCKFFKRDQYGNYVCDVDQKPFECPPVRGECPRFGVPQGPSVCQNDNDCYNLQKCCPDVCLPHLTCKGPH